ncbi:MAG: hypothetical protein AAB403_23570, partial [Planctomycetota bacterium]
PRRRPRPRLLPPAGGVGVKHGLTLADTTDRLGGPVRRVQAQPSLWDFSRWGGVRNSTGD